MEKFADYMVRDIKSGAYLRADKLIEEFVDKQLATKKNLKPDEKDNLLRIQSDAGSMNAVSLNAVIKELKIKNPDTGNEVSEA